MSGASCVSEDVPASQDFWENSRNPLMSGASCVSCLEDLSFEQLEYGVSQSPNERGILC